MTNKLQKFFFYFNYHLSHEVALLHDESQMVLIVNFIYSFVYFVRV